jgi:hypothetical protein
MIPIPTAEEISRLDIKAILALTTEQPQVINSIGSHGESLLQLAIRNKNIEAVRFLLEEGAKVNEQDRKGRTPLHEAVIQKQPVIVQLLIDHKAAVNLQDSRGRTPLHEAVRKKHMEIIKLLAVHGADLNVSDDNQWTPLTLAASLYQYEILNTLIAYENPHPAYQPVPRHYGWLAPLFALLSFSTFLASIPGLYRNSTLNMPGSIVFSLPSIYLIFFLSSKSVRYLWTKNFQGKEIRTSLHKPNHVTIPMMITLLLWFLIQLLLWNNPYTFILRRAHRTCRPRR